ncbi:WXG100 family type VII secretion target [Numidum massiliense]|uniref:WXG100 family type VII secretion target n=1 Tax=Numidum massiliense TaxID=1522315 RepID=UPI0006D5999B|nr:WXG100 family type VII secretion target [Numidum massiliense]
MSEVIRATPAELEAIAKRYLENGNVLEDVNGKLETMAGELLDKWQGASSEAFIKQYEDLKPSFQRMRQLLDEIGQQLHKTAGILRDTDQSIASQINAR